jgi:hypothetical protein
VGVVSVTDTGKPTRRLIRLNRLAFRVVNAGPGPFHNASVCVCVASVLDDRMAFWVARHRCHPADVLQQEFQSPWATTFIRPRVKGLSKGGGCEGSALTSSWLAGPLAQHQQE